LLAQGYQPRRSLAFASWDAEEFGLVGSTEFVEEHASSLGARAVAYLNVDIATSGPGHFSPKAVPSLAPLLREAAAAVQQPNSSMTVLADWLQHTQQQHPKATKAYVGGLGSGSDYTAFLQHAGVASADLRFSPEEKGYYAVYHSQYDTSQWMIKFGDPTGEFHRAVAQIWGWVALSLVESEVLPFRYTEYAEALGYFLEDVRAGYQRVVNATSNATGEELDFGALSGAIHTFAEVARNVDQECMAHSRHSLDELRLRELNDRLMLAERAFLKPEGLPQRPWFKHVVYSPSLHNSYGSEKYPALADAIALGDWSTAQLQLNVLVERIRSVGDVLRSPKELAKGELF